MKTEINRVIEKYKDVKLPLLLFILYTKPTGWQMLMTGICTPKRGRYLKKTIQSKIKKRTSVN
jgi:hypothetical protein